MHWLLYLILGITPPLIWLWYFRRQDIHPESRRQIARIFALGGLVTVPVLALELGFDKTVGALPLHPLAASLAGAFIGIALIEELGKYAVVRWGAIPTPAFDEPIDTVIYMITAAMGFAAVENTANFFFNFSPVAGRELIDPLVLAIARFLGANLLHALASATIGFFIALAILHRREHTPLLWAGVGIATALHGLYDYAIMELSGATALYVLLAVFATLIVVVSLGIRELHRIKPICIPANTS